MMRKVFGIISMILGTALILGALLLFFYNEREDRQAGQESNSMMAEIQSEIERNRETAPSETLQLPDTPVELLRPEDLIMKEAMIKGFPCIGYITIPELALELPVITDWNGWKLQNAPCRFSGTLKGRDLVVMAHSYNSHFGRLSNLTEGSPVQFTDVDGNITYYEVVLMDILNPGEVEEMIAGEYDLTLFSCTPSGKQRVTVRCNMIEK